jgi:hypothetical protein
LSKMAAKVSKGGVAERRDRREQEKQVQVHGQHHPLVPRVWGLGAVLA